MFTGDFNLLISSHTEIRILGSRNNIFQHSKALDFQTWSHDEGRLCCRSGKVILETLPTHRLAFEITDSKSQDELSTMFEFTSSAHFLFVECNF
ncbi:hypothetical protein AVEN_242371-1 [Araneus ventricosus]|uniref:Uncharacterized protein n=1 Tax=Araneus ventricosus TaxID=182803 RepID=A0A4Y2MSQ1_ARAVE|nr:hypothetical protein AVEN_242371-1 [Araneus ventricosus]